ncbi:MAG: hypothetical protein ACPGGE_04255, partial [Poseidonia sp.]
LRLALGRTIVMVPGSGALSAMTPPERAGPLGAGVVFIRTGAVFLLGAAMVISSRRRKEDLIVHPALRVKFPFWK